MSFSGLHGKTDVTAAHGHFTKRKAINAHVSLPTRFIAHHTLKWKPLSERHVCHIKVSMNQFVGCRGRDIFDFNQCWSVKTPCHLFAHIPFSSRQLIQGYCSCLSVSVFTLTIYKKKMLVLMFVTNDNRPGFRHHSKAFIALLRSLKLRALFVDICNDNNYRMHSIKN